MPKIAKKQSPDIGRNVAFAAVAGTVGYVLYYTLFRRNDFKDITATYDGIEPTGSGPSIPKAVGDSTTVVLKFGHRGVGGKFKMGIGVAPAAALGGEFGPVQGWIYEIVDVPKNADWATVSVTIVGNIPNIPDGKKDTLKFVQTETGQLDDRGKYYKVSDWDRNVYDVSGGGSTAFQSFQATYT